jgi:hypothetical protein
MAAASFATGVLILSLSGFYRLGIGGMIAAANAVGAECTNARRHDLCLAIMAGGYPLGAVLGGSAAAILPSATGR